MIIYDFMSYLNGWFDINVKLGYYSPTYKKINPTQQPAAVCTLHMNPKQDNIKSEIRQNCCPDFAQCF